MGQDTASAPAARFSTAYTCAICGVAVPHPDESPSAQASAARSYRPFCSARCQRIDLGNWLGEKYAVPAEHATSDDPEADSDQDE